MKYVYKAQVSILVRFQQVRPFWSDTSHRDRDSTNLIYAANEHCPIFLIKLGFPF